MTINTEEELAALRRIGRIVRETIVHMGSHLRPGITTRALDDIGLAYLTAQGARSAPQLVYNFPGATCISVNNEVAHGIPGDRIVQDGDLVNIDVSAELAGYFADAGHTFMVGNVTEQQQAICQVTQLALQRAIEAVKADVPLSVIGTAIEMTAKEYGCSIILNLGSHGVGGGLHEEPKFIQPYFDDQDTRMLTENMVITIEPFLSNGAWQADLAPDGWTLTTPPEFLCAQYEHTMVVTKTGAMLLTVA